MRTKYPKIVFIANIVIFTLLLLIGFSCVVSIKVFAASVSSANATTNPVNTATSDSVFLTPEAISTITSPVISVVSISFAISTYLLNNSYNLKNMSVSTKTRKLMLVMNQSILTSRLAMFLLLLLVLLLITNICKYYIGFYIILIFIALILGYLVYIFLRFNRERNIIASINKNFKESKLKRIKEAKNKLVFKLRFKTDLKNSDYIFAYIEICYENKYQGMFKEGSEDHRILNLWCESMDSKNDVNPQIPKIEDRFKSFYETLEDLFNNKQLDSKYLSDLYVYFLSELEKVIFKNAFKFKKSNYKIMYSACLSYAFNIIFDVDIIDEFFKSKTETFIYRWLFYRYILLFEYNKFIEDTNFYKPRFHFLDELSSRVKSISPSIKDSHIIFLITSLYLYRNKCLKDINLIFDMDNILEAIKEDLINIDSIIKLKKVKR